MASLPTTFVRRLPPEPRQSSCVPFGLTSLTSRFPAGVPPSSPSPALRFLAPPPRRRRFLGVRSFPPCVSNASRAAASPLINSVHHAATDSSSSPDSLRSRRKSYPALNLCCSISFSALRPERRSRRICSPQISRISAEKRL